MELDGAAAHGEKRLTTRDGEKRRDFFEIFVFSVYLCVLCGWLFLKSEEIYGK